VEDLRFACQVIRRSDSELVSAISSSRPSAFGRRYKPFSFAPRSAPARRVPRQRVGELRRLLIRGQWFQRGNDAELDTPMDRFPDLCGSAAATVGRRVGKSNALVAASSERKGGDSA